jgi:Calx-beta domain
MPLETAWNWPHKLLPAQTGREDIRLALPEPFAGRARAGAPGYGEIRDDEPQISISDVTQYELNGNKSTLCTFVVRLTAAYGQPVTVSYATASGTAATGDGDYVANTGMLTFAPVETTTTVTIKVRADKKRVPSEYFYVDPFDVSGTSLVTKNRGVGTILNDD